MTNATGTYPSAGVFAAAPGASAVQQSAPQHQTQPQQMQQQGAIPNRGPTIPGISLVDALSNDAPIILIIAEEKAGKSTIAATTSVGYPEPGFDPLILAWDKTGPDACIKLGYQPHVMKIGDQPGNRWFAKAKHVMQTLENNAPAIRQRYGAIITDCTSTMVDRLHEDARRFSPNPNPQSHFGDALMQSKEWINRIVDLGLPSIWLAWLRAPEVVETTTAGGAKTKKFIMGGPNILGNTRSLIAGKAHHILYLEKQKVGVGQPGADEDGYLRVFHTRPFENINCHGRYSHVLPEPAPAHLGYILGCITRRGPWAPR